MKKLLLYSLYSLCFIFFLSSCSNKSLIEIKRVFEEEGYITEDISHGGDFGDPNLEYFYINSDNTFETIIIAFKNESEAKAAYNNILESEYGKAKRYGKFVLNYDAKDPLGSKYEKVFSGIFE